MAPNFAATMERIDSALSGVQMATVRDQMTFTLILKALKASLASRLGADVTGDASKATGIDLKSPIALASWQAPEGKGGGGGAAATRSAVTVRVTDRARFERLLATYQEGFGDFDQFFTVAAALSRFAGIIPAAVPVIFASMASDEARGKAVARSSSESKIPSLKPFSHARTGKRGRSSDHDARQAGHLGTGRRQMGDDPHSLSGRDRDRFVVARSDSRSAGLWGFGRVGRPSRKATPSPRPAPRRAR